MYIRLHSQYHWLNPMWDQGLVHIQFVQVYFPVQQVIFGPTGPAATLGGVKANLTS